MRCQLQADDFFKIGGVDFLDKPTKDERGIYDYTYDQLKKEEFKDKFHPCLEVEISMETTLRTGDLIAKVYFYDQRERLIAKVDEPAKVERGYRNRKARLFAWPPRVGKDREYLYFEMPAKVMQTPRWEAVVVFGDKDGATAKSYPTTGRVSHYGFPEDKLVKARPRIKRGLNKPELIEYVHDTKIRSHPRITFYMRIPDGYSNLEETNGTLALCCLGFDVEHIKRQLDGSVGDLKTYLTFADKHGLAILCWGSRSHWDASKSWDEQSREAYKRMDGVLDDIAEAWADAVRTMHRKYGLPDEDILLRGNSGSAQFALRLALRKPEYFLAVHASIPSSFDKPTPEGRNVLWCLTTGELESGYGRSLRFLKDCKDLGYPIIYKAEIGVGHSGTARTDQLGRLLFEYALSVREKRSERLEELRNSGVFRPELKAEPWVEDFKDPPFVADVVNQEVYPVEDRDMVPEPFLVPLPTEQFANLWREKN